MKTLADGTPTVSAELELIDQQHPGWHAWHSDSGRCYAAHDYSKAEIRELIPGHATWDFTASGVTADAPTPSLLILAIAEHEHAVQVARAMFSPDLTLHPFDGRDAA